MSTKRKTPVEWKKSFYDLRKRQRATGTKYNPIVIEEDDGKDHLTIDSLPNEILSEILSYVVVEGEAASLTLVCKRWHEATRKLPAEYTERGRTSVSDFFSSSYLLLRLTRMTEIRRTLCRDTPVPR
jgi:hypothetical protein